jgi:hypothetical protein
VNTKATAEAVLARLKGEQVSKFRAAAMAGTAGAGVAALVYRTLRETSR